MGLNLANTPTLRKQEDIFRLPAQKADSVFFDEVKPSELVSSLALRIRNGGSRRWIFFYRFGDRLKKITTGDAGAWTLAQARAKAREFRVLVDNRRNPAALKQAEKVNRPNESRYFQVWQANIWPMQAGACAHAVTPKSAAT